MSLLDWTTGGEGLAYQWCPACRQVWYFRRDFCPCCGQHAPSGAWSRGEGMVHACTRIYRAPSDAFRALSPYHVVLVDLDEGFRAMGHGEAEMVIGDRVCCTVRMLGNRVLPYFSKAGG